MDDITRILEICKDKSANSNQEKFLLQPFDYLSKVPGQQISLKLLHALNHWFDISPVKFGSIYEIIEMLRNVSLLIDDIEDDSTTRRGLPVAHSIFGVASTLNTIIYVYYILLEKILLLDHPEAVKVFTEEMQEMHRGQGIEIYWRNNFKPPSYLEYKLMALQKLGSLFRLGARLMQLFCKKTIDVSRLIVIFGMYVQIWDDYYSISEDITEGKFGFPMIHAIQNEKNSEEVLNILKQRTADVQVKKDCISHMQTLGSLQYSYDLLISLEKEAREEVDKLGSNPLMDRLLNELRSPKT